MKEIGLILRLECFTRQLLNQLLMQESFLMTSKDLRQESFSAGVIQILQLLLKKMNKKHQDLCKVSHQKSQHPLDSKELLLELILRVPLLFLL